MALDSESAIRERFDARIARITEACTLCGKCFEACPMTPFAGLQGAASETVVRGVIDIINGRPHVSEAAVWTGACEKSGVCIEACPEDVNPREMISYAKLKLQMAAHDKKEISENSRDYFKTLSRTIRLMAALQIEPGQFKRLTAVKGEKKKKADAVFYFGCNILQTPHILLSCMDVFDRMGLDYEVAGGVGHCCGINHIRRGDLEAGAAMGKKSLQHFRAYEPEKVITFCPTCQMQYSDFISLYSEPGEPALPFVHITQYLADNLEALRALYVRPVKKRVAVHLHGGTGGVEENVMTILKSVPGLEVVDIDQHAGYAYQCPTISVPGVKEGLREKLFSSSRKAEVDSLVTVYHGCHRELCGAEADHPFEVENFMSILGQAMGFEYPDRVKTFKLYEDMDRVLAEAGDLLRAHGIDPEEARSHLRKAVYP